ncbi:5-formyltetrahydrofolate cyclo-ligase [Paenibacillus sp. 32O-W]|uniref:5-formyltetrahydrofolate cyclo-ligase n=1 Tax=Paenibacillus sp. 32O-W TaxID=1695218 RepID=UPI00072006E1|nr:5-formyltetrahydrofolate cyclo-ligase [Paenibacillus sp. 32O-W]ALS29658.1 5-formyltetrahydrofolate cyclo-ligase [Paenibacillus sp. 32O-W]
MQDKANDTAGQKREWRRRMSALRDGLPPERRLAWSLDACRAAAAWMEERGIESFMTYVPFRSELDTRPLIEWGWERGVAVTVPRANPADRSMTLYRIAGWDDLETGAYGIPEPNPSRAKAFRRIPDAVWVPGLAFDLRGGRLGYGGGYYDRFDAYLRSLPGGRPPWIGMAYEAQLTADVPTENHDARVDGVMTERGFYPAVRKGS